MPAVCKPFLAKNSKSVDPSAAFKIYNEEKSRYRLQQFSKKAAPSSLLKIHATILQILLAFIFESGYIIFAGWF